MFAVITNQLNTIIRHYTFLHYTTFSLTHFFTEQYMMPNNGDVFLSNTCT